jgi:adenylate cyclase
MNPARTDRSKSSARVRIDFSNLRGRWWKGLTVGVVTGLIGAILVLTPLGANFEKHVGLTWLFKTRGPIEPPPNVAVVAINSRAIEGLGLPHLPRDWPRSIHGRLVQRLTELGAAVIVFDMDFQRPKKSTDDLKFANAVAKSQRVVLFERLNGKRQPILDVNGQQTGTIWVEELIPPIPALAKAAKGLAPFPVPKVQVNIFQFWAFKPSVGDAGTMPVVALQVYAQNVYPRWRQVLEQAGAAGANGLPRSGHDLRGAAEIDGLMRTLRRDFNNDPALGKRILAILDAEPPQNEKDADQQLMKALTQLYAGRDNRYLNFYGPPGTIPTIPYNAILRDDNPGNPQTQLDLSNKVVFVGFSDLYDPGQPDRFYTVFTRDDGVDLSGVEIAATAFANLATDRSLKHIDAGWMFALLFAVGLILGAGIYLLTATIAVPLALSLSGLYVVAVQNIFNSADLWLPLATPILVQLPIALFVGLTAQYMLKRRGEQRLTEAVSYYLPENVVRELTSNQLDPNSLNKVVYGICFATDMSGFTSLSQTMNPDQLAKFMNSYFDALAHALKRHRVDVTEFHADTIMCAWTADDAEALNRNYPAFAGLAVVDAVTRFNEQTEGVNLNARVGLDEGSFYLGHTGGGGRMGYSILGDCANTAARLESLNKHLHTHILASEPVVSGTRNLLLRPLGKFLLVGKNEPVSVVEVMAKKENVTDQQTRLCQRFAEALLNFESQQWSNASQLFEAILKSYPEDGPSHFYVARCRENLERLPEGDNPFVIRMDAK